MLDTSVLIEFYRKKNKTKSFFFELTQDYTHFVVSAITEYEIYIGSNPEQDNFWNSFFEQLTVLPFVSGTSQIAVKIAKEIKQNGMQLDIPDLLIGATALENNLPIATFNSKHFKLIEGIEIVVN